MNAPALFIPAKRPVVEGGKPFRLDSGFAPAGDQPQAIDRLVKGLEGGERDQVLLGVTGSGKTFTIAHAIERLGRPGSEGRREKMTPGQTSPCSRLGMT